MPQSIAEKVAKLCGTSFCARRGRPRATDKALENFVCGGVDVEVLRQEKISRLERTECRPADMALIEKELIEEGMTMVKKVFLPSLFRGLYKTESVPVGWGEVFRIITEDKPSPEVGLYFCKL